MSGLRDEGDGFRSNEARSVNTSGLILSGLLTVTAKDLVIMGLMR